MQLVDPGEKYGNTLRQKSEANTFSVNIICTGVLVNHFDVLHQTAADTERGTKKRGRISFGDQFNDYFNSRLRVTCK